MVKLFTDIPALRGFSATNRLAGRRIAVVPTMGALHDGHLALIREARRRSDVVITTVFVNPAQFGPSEDFTRYPRTLDEDVRRAEEAGSDCIFAPADGDMYPAGYSTYVHVTGIEDLLEGRSRPGHFRGVATVVLKLFAIARPHCAVFGQKDAQQVAVIRRMVRDLNLDVEIIVLPTVRDSDGLAMSSRNRYLTPEERREAPVLYRALQLGARLVQDGGVSGPEIRERVAHAITAESSGVIDYVSVADEETLEEIRENAGGRPVLISLAVRFGTTRLIDNIVVPGL